MLYPIENTRREIKDLSGLWSFRLDPEEEGERDYWYDAALMDAIDMPVPASYNDLTQDLAIHDHIGVVWYQRTFFAPERWKRQRVFVRVGSASHHAAVWLNGQEVARHKGGFLPFEADVTDSLKLGAENRLSISVDNRLDWTTLPPGQIKTVRDTPDGPEVTLQHYRHDFYNYSGIHRPVRLLVIPETHIRDISVTTDLYLNEGKVGWKVETEGEVARMRVLLFNAEGQEVMFGEGVSGEMTVRNAIAWEPGKGYLYTLRFEAMDGQGDVIDVYSLPVGIRRVEVRGKTLQINDKPFYFKGFGKHEDADLRGKGHDDVTNIKDFNLLEWIGANSFRTSHYPYSEEILNLADRRGIVIIDEAPAVGLRSFEDDEDMFVDEKFGPETLEHHRACMREMIARDKNHPCVVAWSVANEARLNEDRATDYFQQVIDETRQLDPSRPVTIVVDSDVDQCDTARYVDFICLNRYYSWYFDEGRLESIEPKLESELKRWWEVFGKPVLLSEYGTDTLVGFHSDPPTLYTEEYQCEMIAACNRVLDRLDFVIGEHIWNFADFATKQEIRRVNGNKKGVFTRQRQPKMVAHMVRKRWTEGVPESSKSGDSGL